MACVVSKDGDQWTIDVDHPAYPRVSKLSLPGVGTKLKGLLSLIGIKASSGCSCNKRAVLMNERGVEWCEQNKAEILAHNADPNNSWKRGINQYTDTMSHEGDFGYQMCAAFCNADMKANHCNFCKCKSCMICPS